MQNVTERSLHYLLLFIWLYTGRAVSSVDEPIINDDDEANYSEPQAETEEPVETEVRFC